jgi:hypothetical protein
MSFGEEKMSDAAILSRLAPIIRAKKIFWINGEYFREGEVVHWECFVKLLDEAVRIGFDEYLEKYEDAVDLYDAYVREELPDVEAALLFILNSFPRVAEKLRAE